LRLVAAWLAKALSPRQGRTSKSFEADGSIRSLAKAGTGLARGGSHYRNCSGTQRRASHWATRQAPPLLSGPGLADAAAPLRQRSAPRQVFKRTVEFPCRHGTAQKNRAGD